jgi:hypothetical protein
MIGSNIADGIARGLDGMHLHIGQIFQNIRHITQFGPVKLDILAGGKMAITLVSGRGDHGQLSHLSGIQRAIGNGNTQHISMSILYASPSFSRTTY